MQKGRYVGAAVLVLGAAALLVRLFVAPSTDRAEPGDAVVVLAGDPETRLPLGEDLARSASAPLVLSAPEGETNDPARALCRTPRGLTIMCITSDPPDTRGEARAIGRLVAEHGWHRIEVVTSTYHISRARVLFDRCTRAQVLMVEARPMIPPGAWADVILHEAGGLLDTIFDRSC